MNTRSIWYADVDNDVKGDYAIRQITSCKPVGYVTIKGGDCLADAAKSSTGNCGCNNIESSCLDCAGIANGTATIDAYIKCSEGTTRIAPVTDPSMCITTSTIKVLNTCMIRIFPH